MKEYYVSLYTNKFFNEMGKFPFKKTKLATKPRLS